MLTYFLFIKVVSKIQKKVWISKKRKREKIKITSQADSPPQPYGLYLSHLCFVCFSLRFFEKKWNHYVHNILQTLFFSPNALWTSSHVSNYFFYNILFNQFLQMDCQAVSNFSVINKLCGECFSRICMQFLYFLCNSFQKSQTLAHIVV